MTLRKVDLACVAADNGSIGTRRAEPVTCGVPWAKGQLEDLGRLTLVDEQGTPQLFQARCLDRWSDGSVRWSLIDWFADSTAGRSSPVSLRSDQQDHPFFEPIRILHPTKNSLVVDTGRAVFHIGPGGGFPFERVEVDGKSVIDGPHSTFLVRDDEDREFRVDVEDLSLEECGPVRAAVRVRGRLIATGREPLLDVLTDLHFFKNSATVRFHLSITNTRSTRHKGGIWSLGSAGSVYLEDASLILTLPPGEEPEVIRCSPEPGLPSERANEYLELYQDSSGGENWQSKNHLNRNRRVPCSFRGYRLRSADVQRLGKRATPCVSLERGDHHVAFSTQHFWQNFPKAIEVTTSKMVLRLFPRQFDDTHEIQGGEQKTHVFHLAYSRDEVTKEPLAWCRSPLTPLCDPDWYAQTNAVPYLIPNAEDANKAYVDLVDLAVEEPDCFESKREAIDEYGWRHFGDIYGDHEAVFHRGPEPLISHYNNQYDAIRGFAIQFFRSGDPRWFKQMSELTQHVIDIDLYHTDGDKSTYNRGLFWHTFHYVDVDLATHRAYPDLPGVPGGGPSTGHLYTTGLMLYFFLTGNLMARDAVLSLGQYVVDADDGTKTIFRFLDRGYTGTVSESGFDEYRGPGRTPANAIGALIDAHRVGGDIRYLEKAEQLIRRCIHPNDVIESRNLLDAENRWFYTMFLWVLGGYLDHKAERGELNYMYGYARAALLHYTAWASEHEYPYLDKPEILEYPTETWAAQDMRKSDMFNFASRHADPAQRSKLRERARFFFDYSTRKLAELETRGLCRPVVLLLSLGHSQAWFDHFVHESAPPPESANHDFGEPESFVPQKQRAKKRAIAFVSSIAVLGLTFFLVWMFS